MLPYLFDVQAHIIAPVRAVPGEVIAVTPGHSTAPVAVMRPTATGPWDLVRVGPQNYGGLLAQLRAGVLVERTPGGGWLLTAHARRSGAGGRDD